MRWGRDNSCYTITIIVIIVSSFYSNISRIRNFILILKNFLDTNYIGIKTLEPNKLNTTGTINYRYLGVDLTRVDSKN